MNPTESCKKHAKLLEQAAARARRLTFVSGFRLRPDPCSRCGGFRLVVDRPAAPAAKLETRP
jgi:hypothetical protein